MSNNYLYYQYQPKKNFHFLKFHLLKTIKPHTPVKNFFFDIFYFEIIRIILNASAFSCDILLPLYLARFFIPFLDLG